MSSQKILFKNARIVNEGRVYESDLLVSNGMIEKIAATITPAGNEKIIDAAGKYLMPGVIDDQVHFREPGLTHKADIASESAACVAGGVTSFMEMPNTKPQAVTQELLEDKYQIAARVSPANYSFYMGVTNDNLEEVLKTDRKNVCGLKIFMGSSTGNMLVDDEQTLENVFSRADMLIATHCEKEEIVRANEELYFQKFGEDIPAYAHPEIRSVEACIASSRLAVDMAKKYNTRLHVLHISTADELALFDNTIPLAQKRITAEVCVHHLWFSKDDYKKLGMQIKCNPAIKEAHHREALMKGLLDNHLDVIATDHAPHTLQEKMNKYRTAPSGLPLIQHTLLAMMEFVYRGVLPVERVAEKMAHAVATCYRIDRRGYIREGYHADLVLVDPNALTEVRAAGLFYKCGWSPFEGTLFHSAVTHTVVSGQLAFENGKINQEARGRRMLFNM